MRIQAACRVHVNNFRKIPRLLHDILLTYIPLCDQRFYGKHLRFVLRHTVLSGYSRHA